MNAGRRWAALFLIIVCAVGIPAAAFAAAPVASGEMDVQLWLAVESGKSIAIISVIVPDETPLPVTVRVPVPDGTSVEWAGEIGGGGPDSDVAKQPVLKKGDGGSYAEFELDRHRQAQIEVGGIALGPVKNGFTSTMKWTQSTPASITAFSVRVPAGAVEARIEPAPAGEPDRNEAGETLYTLPSKKFKTGEVMQLTATYLMVPSTVPVKQTSLPAGTLITVLAAIAVVLVVGLLFILRRQRQAAVESQPGDDSDAQ